MAAADYHACDRCGAKTFYDADIDGEWVDGHWRYGWDKGGDDYLPFLGHVAFALCHECEKTHEIVVRPIATPDHIMPAIQTVGPLDSEKGE